MKKRSCFGLWTVVWLLAAVGVIVFFVVAPWTAVFARQLFPAYRMFFWPGLAYTWVVAALYALALFDFARIVRNIVRDRSFCLENARRLRSISILALADTLLCAAVMLALLFLHALHPGLFLLLLLISAVGAGITIASAALSHLTVKAAQMQDENDLTI